MAKKIASKKAEPVRCSDCMYAIRDTEGFSYNIETKEFFLCRCRKNHHIDRFG